MQLFYRKASVIVATYEICRHVRKKNGGENWKLLLEEIRDSLGTMVLGLTASSRKKAGVGRKRLINMNRESKTRNCDENLLRRISSGELCMVT